VWSASVIRAVCSLEVEANAMPYVIRYCFSQRFPVHARKAYEWCADYSPEDPVLMGNEAAERRITRVTDATVILTDIFHTGKGDVEKQKLVQLYPDRLRWVSTHLAGPNRYSQFIYEISAEGNRASRLDFTALHLEYEKENLDSEAIKLLADKLKKEDSALWKRLAKAMAKELGK
jgi:hypothetical protein